MKLKIPQVRVLRCFTSGRPLLNRAKIAERAGFSELSGTVTRVLNGLREGSSSGAAHPGLLTLGYIERIDLEVEEGVTETCYRITDAGVRALAAWEKENRDEQINVRDKASSINHRYKRGSDAEDS